MVDDAIAMHLPTVSGGSGKENLRNYYADVSSPAFPPTPPAIRLPGRSVTACSSTRSRFVVTRSKANGSTDQAAALSRLGMIDRILRYANITETGRFFTGQRRAAKAFRTHDRTPC
jgi:hypothetical protein